MRLALALVLAAGGAGAQPLDLPGTAELVSESRAEAGRLSLALGPWREGGPPSETFSGPTLRQVWRIPGTGLTTAEIAARLTTEAEAAGYEVLYACATQACGGYDFRFALDLAPPPDLFVDLADYRYFAAGRGEDDRLFALISRSGQAGFVQVSQVGGASSAPAAEARTPGDQPGGGDIGAELELRGRAILPGLRFATGSAQLAEGEVAALDALAAYLIAHPDRRIALVGHTDATGALETNIALSRRRAGSVLERLVNGHGVPRPQLEAQGMGYLAPVAPNLTEAGREANRRVEAILLSTR